MRIVKMTVDGIVGAIVALLAAVGLFFVLVYATGGAHIYGGDRLMCFDLQPKVKW